MKFWVWSAFWGGFLVGILGFIGISAHLYVPNPPMPVPPRPASIIYHAPVPWGPWEPDKSGEVVAIFTPDGGRTWMVPVPCGKERAK